MRFENEFTVPASPDEVWEALMDMDRVARCMPGATLLENHDDRFVGRLKVKVGPIRMSYRGSAEFVERDPTARRAVITAKGREERGAGTAGIKVTASLTATDGGETRVDVLTDLEVSGKPAQFGGGVMAEVGTAIVDEFAARLADELRADELRADELPAGELPASERPAGDRTATEDRRSTRDDHADALDLADLAGGPLARRAGVALAAGIGALGLLLLLRRRSRPAVTVVYVGLPIGEAGKRENHPVY